MFYDQGLPDVFQSFFCLVEHGRHSIEKIQIILFTKSMCLSLKIGPIEKHPGTFHVKPTPKVRQALSFHAFIRHVFSEERC